jgi:uncharacterized protein YukE
VNDLIVNADSSSPEWSDMSGTRVVASAQSLFDSSSGLEYALNGTVAALDLLAFVANPLKELVMAGVGFLIEHVSFLNEPIEWVAGAPDSINATKDTWNNVAQTLDQAGEDLKAEIESLAEWEGDAAEAYKMLLADFGDAIKAGGIAADVMGGYMMVMGIWTAITRGLLLELICDFVSRAIMYAVAALASSWITLGGSFAAMIGGIIADAMAVMAKISGHIAKLGQAMQQLSTRFTKLNELVGEIGKVLDKFGTAKKLDLGFDEIAKSTNLKFDQLSNSIWDDAVPTPNSGGFRTNYQLDNTHTIYDTLTNPWGSGNLPGDWATDTYNWKPFGEALGGNNLGDIITGYGLTGLKSGLSGTSDATDYGG